MGASSAEIDQEIRDARNELDQKLGVLERRAASSARRYGRYAACVAIGVLAVTVGVVIYRRQRDRALPRHLHQVLFDTIRDLPEEVTSRLKKKLPVRVVVTDRDSDESSRNPWMSLVQQVGPAAVGSVAGAVFARMRGTPPDATPTE